MSEVESILKKLKSMGDDRAIDRWSKLGMETKNYLGVIHSLLKS